VRLDRAATKLLALASTMGVVGAITVTSAGPVAAATGGAREQAVVALAGDWSVTVPGVHVQALLPGVQAEIVDGTATQLAQLAATPGVLGVEPNLKAHLESDTFGGRGDGPDAAAPTLDSTQTPGMFAAAPTSSVLAPSTLGGNAGKADAGRGVTVALIDTGVADTDALNRASGRLVDAVDTSGLNTANGKVKEHGVFSDGYGHGTFMASLIAGGQTDASGNLGIGVASGATIDVVKVADDAGNTSLAAVLAGLNWVATHSDQVDVANLSLSVDKPSKNYGIDPLNFAVTMTRASGVTVVVAAGNTPGVVGDPGFSPSALTVGAADTTGSKPTVASFSGFANVDGISKPDVVAAGVNILGSMPTDSLISQEFPAARQPNGLFRGSGTSQSTAIVSGLAALYLQSHHSASPAEVKSAIRDAADNIAGGRSDGQGLVAIPTSNRHASSNTGENSLNIREWLSTAPQWGDLFSNGVFDGRRWGARRWSGDGWDARRWAGVTFDARRWSDVTFDARLWSARMWASRMWASRMWATASWGDAS
jgi:serine protease AprX